MNRQPKLSIGSWAFAFGPFESRPWPFADILRYAVDAGYDGVEVNGFVPHPVPDLYDTVPKRKELLSEIRAHGLGVSAYAPDFRQAPPADAKKADYLEFMKRYLEFASSLETQLLRVDTVTPPVPQSDTVYRERFARLIDTWQASAELAAAYGICMVWEFEPGFWLNRPSEVLRTVQTVGHPAFRILFDTSHAYMSGVACARHVGEKERLAGGIGEYARMLAPYIGHFHLIDSDGTLHDGDTSTHAAFGAGLIDFAQFLRENGELFAGCEWWCADFCFNAEAEAWGRQAVPFIRRQIREAGS